MGLVIAIHLIVCLLLIGVILIQAGRGGGLVEGFSGVESMFGTKTNTFLTRTTTTLAILFFITCISLALLSARQSRSLIRNIKTQEPAEQVETETENTTSEETAKSQEMPQVTPLPTPLEQEDNAGVPKAQ